MRKLLSDEGGGGGGEPAGPEMTFDPITGDLTINTKRDANTACAAMTFAASVAERDPQAAASVIFAVERSPIASTSDAVRTTANAMRSRLAGNEAFQSALVSLGAQ
jgi:hypothetical protein